MSITKTKRITYGTDVYMKDSAHPDTGDYIEATEWTNGDGYEVVFYRHKRTDGIVRIDLSWDELTALRKLLNQIYKDEK